MEIFHVELQKLCHMKTIDFNLLYEIIGSFYSNNFEWITGGFIICQAIYKY